ncbi:MAG TPA: glycosyltransferase family 1 protein, partial [Mycobacteriales bacterium]|nr:glycosyltransferase family 1 protein [Mycobacteriales bacterium]
ARTADLVVVPTRAVAEQLASHVVLSAERVRVVGEGVSAALALPGDSAEREKALGLVTPYLLTVATLEPRKGLDLLLAALASPEAPDLPLLVVGQPGWGAVDPLAEAARAGLAPGRVRVLGRVSDPDLAVLLRRATALVVPSRAEGFGLPVLEAMAAGTPVITSDDPALVEVGGSATWVAEEGNLAAGLRAVAEDEALRSRMRAAGLLRAQDFSWDDAADALWLAYADVGGSAA